MNILTSSNFNCDMLFIVHHEWGLRIIECADFTTILWRQRGGLSQKEENSVETEQLTW